VSTNDLETSAERGARHAALRAGHARARADHVGSKDEDKGRTGFAHLFEHMMFQGFEGYDFDYIPVIQEVGGAVNGSTTQDRTNYWELLPSNFLETALFMEAGRMKGLLDAMTQAKLDNQRDVVKNEKHQRIDNQPYGQTLYRIGETMFPDGTRTTGRSSARWRTCRPPRSTT
jgi:zinc protease